MRQVFVSQNLIEVESFKDILMQDGISCTIKNQRGSSLAGEVPFAEVFPELWVINDEDYQKAKELLDDWEKDDVAGGTTWKCSVCGEGHGPEFSNCWKCGTERNSNVAKLKFPTQGEKDGDPDSLTFGFLAGLILGVVLCVGGGLGWWYYYSLSPYSGDRNSDGKIDVTETSRAGVRVEVKEDNNFDGIFETVYTYNSHGDTKKGEIDRNQDGTPDLIEDYSFGIFRGYDLFDMETGQLKKRIHYKLGAKVREEIDLDGDGEFETTIKFDANEFPIDVSR